jgi:hypothetical protein
VDLCLRLLVIKRNTEDVSCQSVESRDHGFSRLICIVFHYLSSYLPGEKEGWEILEVGLNPVAYSEENGSENYDNSAMSWMTRDRTELYKP